MIEQRAELLEMHEMSSPQRNAISVEFTRYGGKVNFWLSSTGAGRGKEAFCLVRKMIINEVRWLKETFTGISSPSRLFRHFRLKAAWRVEVLLGSEVSLIVDQSNVGVV
ncbi:hypothetical protein CBL_04861 [Carabus blaptoides fortunei]